MIKELSILTESQVENFKTFGFLMRRKVFSAEEMERKK